MKIIFNILSAILVIAVIFLSTLNTQTVFNLAFWKGNTDIFYNVILAKLILIIFLLGLLAGIFWSASFYIQVQKKLKEYQKKLEKTSVQSTEDSSKVSVLEEKIKVLEKALQTALNKEE